MKTWHMNFATHALYTTSSGRLFRSIPQQLSDNAVPKRRRDKLVIAYEEADYQCHDRG